MCQIQVRQAYIDHCGIDDLGSFMVALGYRDFQQWAGVTEDPMIIDIFQRASNHTSDIQMWVTGSFSPAFLNSQLKKTCSLRHCDVHADAMPVLAKWRNQNEFTSLLCCAFHSVSSTGCLSLTWILPLHCSRPLSCCYIWANAAVFGSYCMYASMPDVLSRAQYPANTDCWSLVLTRLFKDDVHGSDQIFCFADHQLPSQQTRRLQQWLMPTSKTGKALRVSASQAFVLNGVKVQANTHPESVI